VDDAPELVRVAPAQARVRAGGVGERLVRAEPEQERVAAAPLEPAARPGRPVVLATMHPADEHVRETALREELGHLPDEPFAERVAGKAAVAVHERGLGADDVRRVADEQVEALAGDRLEEVAEPALDGLGPGQERGEGRELERARGDAGGAERARGLRWAR